VAAPSIPYIEAPEIPLGFLQHLPVLGDLIDPKDPPSIKPFGTLVALAVYIGTLYAMQQARERKLDTRYFSDSIFWTVATGFVLSHVFDAIFYHPAEVKADPLYLLRVWEGLSSYGGFIGALIGVIAWKIYRKKKILEYMDLMVAGMPLAWVFGRAGCASVHDHPGRISDHWLAVRFPNTVCPAGFPDGAVCGRFDLGLIEMLLTIPLAITVMVLVRRNRFRPVGFYIGLVLTSYAVYRFPLDFLRAEHSELAFRGATDPRYGSLTPAQWVCFAGVAVGLFFLKRTWGKPYVRVSPAEGEWENDFEAGQDAAGDDDPYGRTEAPKRKKKKDRPPANAADDAPAAKKAVKKKKRAKSSAAASGDAETAGAEAAEALTSAKKPLE
jgi:phosphatidylglycerol:prolipoprotein diacylglycerol transferase